MYFLFSPRKGTVAYTYSDRVDSLLIKERCRRMRKLGNLKRNAFYNKCKGKTFEILIEGKQKGPQNFLKGITSNYIPVLFKGDEHLKNTIAHVTIDEVNENNQVFGTIHNF